MNPIRLHLPGIPHTITRMEYTHDAFTGKVLRFSPMMRARGFEVYHYGVETSESGATKEIQLMTKDEWESLRVQSYIFLHPTATEEEARKVLDDPTTFFVTLANWDTPLYKEFNKRLLAALKVNYRSTTTDIFCMPIYKYHAIDHIPMIVVEHGIGYPNSSSNYRIFESYTMMHHQIGKEQTENGKNYWFVVPNYYDTLAWPLSLTPHVNTVGFLGRVFEGKGCHEIVEVARRMPHVRFILCGQGDPKPFLVEPNISYKPPIHGSERAEYLGSLVAALFPSRFVEPFCGAAVEAQLCGTPIITKDYGAQTETVEQFKTGLRCHTLSDYVYGIELAISGFFDRTYIRNRAVRLYGLETVGYEYEYAFKTIMDVHNGSNGWYSRVTHMPVLQEVNPLKTRQG